MIKKGGRVLMSESISAHENPSLVASVRQYCPSEELCHVAVFIVIINSYSLN